MNKSLFFTLILLGIMLLAGSLLFVTVNQPGLRFSDKDISVLAQDIARGEDRLTVAELSQRIISAQDNYMLIDVRSNQLYQQRHIKTANHVSLTELLTPDVMAGLPRDRAVILYSSDSAGAAQAAAILRLSGIAAYSLAGGYRHWTAYMTDPSAADIASDEPDQLAKYDAIRCYLEGDYVAEAGLVVRQAATGGFTPPLQAVEPDEDSGDPLGLGLGLEFEIPVTEQLPGLGGGAAPAGLNLGEGC